MRISPPGRAYRYIPAGGDIQAAIDALPAAGGRVELGPGTHTISTGLTATKAVEIVGAGGTGQDNLLANGVTILNVASGQVGITLGDGASSRFAGAVLRNIHIKAQSGATGGVWLRRINNWLLDRVVVSGFSGASAYGIYSDGTGNVNQYGTLIDCSAHNCTIGLDLKLSNGVVLLGGYFDGNSNGSGSGIIVGSIGVRIQSGDTLRMIGTRVQYYETCVSLAGGGDHELHGCRIEAGFTTGISIAANYCSVIGGSINNNIGGSTGTGVLVDAAASDTLLVLPKIQAVGTTITDNGTNTVRLHDCSIRFPNGGDVRIGDAVVTRGSTGQIRIQDNLWVNLNVVVDANDNNAKLLFGNANDTNLYRSAANTLKTDDKFLATSGLGVGNSASATTLGTVTRKIEVFDASGASLGFVPVYDAIT